ncbi:MAG: hypothetical protein JNM39_15820 [Bdellovibrionaceae bacterium]|jgi:hypothetical protein|nr:hypothetical protein [Pseudobdellovibrionaceae bacterium]
MALKKPKVDSTAKKVPKAKPATGFAPLKFKEHTITQKRSGRFEVLNSKGKNVNGPDKVKILLDAKVIKGSFKKAAKEEAAAT